MALRRLLITASVLPAAAMAFLSAIATPARADLQICNRMSYVVEAAIGLEDKDSVTTRGWFRLDPGQCRFVLQGEPPAENYFLHARTLPIYGAAPTAQAGQVDLCVGPDNFTIGNARLCLKAGQRLVRFTAIKPSPTEKGLTAGLSEESEYTSEQARDAGIQRLLVIAGYDATPIDGIRSSKTDAVLGLFLQDNKLPPTAAGRADIFDLLIAAAQRPDGAGFAWCNETAYPVMAAIGIEDKGSVTTRGWYRIAPGMCLRPELSGRPTRIYSFAEAVDGSGRALRSADRPLSWGGNTVLCTRTTRFELFDQSDCKLKGLSSAGFALIEIAAGGTTVRFK